jgi:phosphoadenosine phosphosulfate reductase
MQKALKDMKAWISGIRRDQTSVRAHAKILELQDDGLLKINPLLNWTKEDIKRYSQEHHLPAHPLFQRGYRSIGCSPCTIAIGINDDERAGRWAGREKVECGLHTDMFRHKDMAELKSDFRIDPVEAKEQ